VTKQLLVKITGNFERNLEDIERFLLEAEAPLAFDGLLDELSDVVIPNLERYPEIGRAFLQRPVNSVEVANAVASLMTRLASLAIEPNTIREYVLKHYMILYASIGDTIFLLSVCHHRQLSFDLAGHWQ
jgi:plasmid stabilization system protein ParE